MITGNKMALFVDWTGPSNWYLGVRTGLEDTVVFDGVSYHKRWEEEKGGLRRISSAFRAEEAECL